MEKGTLLFAFTALVLLGACSMATQKQQEEDVSNMDAVYQLNIDNWHKEREESLVREDGWLALIGLYWLEPGKNTFGSAKMNDDVFPEKRVAKYAGAFILENNEVRLHYLPFTAKTEFFAN